MFFKTFRWSFAVTIVAMIVAFLYGGWQALALTFILGIFETSLSFDNAVVNAKVLRNMSEFWQKMFLTVGILIAVFGMRILFPLIIVGVTADMNPMEAFTLAMEKGDPNTPGSYSYLLNEAHPQIAAFGGMFLLMLFLNFLFETKEHYWFKWLEKPFAKFGNVDGVSVVVSILALLAAAEWLAPDKTIVLVSGMFGLVTYLAVNGLGNAFAGVEEDDEETNGEAGRAVAGAVAKGGIFSFLYLEVLDASFSFDGVIGAFAITSDPIIIALGLGLIGAMFVRSITIYLVRQGTLDEFVYLEHGAHWAIGALATILLLSMSFHINEVITGLIGVAFIGLSFWSSIRYNKKHRAEIEPTPDAELVNG